MPDNSTVDANNLVRSGDLVRRLETTRDDVIGLKQGYDALKGDISSLSSSVEKLVTKFEEARRTNWPLIAVMAGVLPVFLTGAGFIMSSYTNSAISPVNAAILQLQTNNNTLSQQIHELTNNLSTMDRDDIGLKQQVTGAAATLKASTDELSVLAQRSSASVEADSVSRTDREQLNARVKTLENELAVEMADRRSDGASFKTHLGEIETQFHGVTTEINLDKANQQRVNALLWEKTFGGNYPATDYFPESKFNDPSQIGFDNR